MEPDYLISSASSYGVKKCYKIYEHLVFNLLCSAHPSLQVHHLPTWYRQESKLKMASKLGNVKIIRHFLSNLPVQQVAPQRRISPVERMTIIKRMFTIFLPQLPGINNHMLTPSSIYQLTAPPPPPPAYRTMYPSPTIFYAQQQYPSNRPSNQYHLSQPQVNSHSNTNKVARNFILCLNIVIIVPKPVEPQSHYQDPSEAHDRTLAEGL